MRSCVKDDLVGSAEPAIDGDDLDVVQAKTPPVPTLDTEDKTETLSGHKEEVVDAIHDQLSDEGLSLLQKMGALGVIVGLCVLFVRSKGPRVSHAGRHGAYEKSMA